MGGSGAGKANIGDGGIDYILSELFDAVHAAEVPATI